MRSRFRSARALLVGIAGLALLAGPTLASAGGTGAALAATPSPWPSVVDSPAAGCTNLTGACLNQSNAVQPGQPPQVFRVRVGDPVEVALLGRQIVGPNATWTWSAMAVVPTVLAKVSETAGNAVIYRADFKAVAVGSTSVNAMGQMTCTPPCPGPIEMLTWTVDVTGTGTPTPTPTPIPTPACSPTANLCLTAQNAAHGDPLSASFIVKVGAVIQVALAGQPSNPGTGLQWQSSSYDPTVVAKQGETGSSGFYLATFTAIANGTSTISATGDFVCRPIPCPPPTQLLRWVIGVGGPPTPEAPTNLMVLPNGGGNVSLSFTPPGAGADFYAIYGYSYPSGHTIFKVVPANATPTLSGLTPGEWFTFTAIAYNVNGWGKKWANWAPWAQVT